MKKILICGGSGFIGRNLVENFSKNKKIKIYSTYYKSKKPNVKNVKWIRADLKSKKSVYNILKNKDVVIQAAATTSGAKDILNKPYIHVTDNAIMNSLLLQASHDLGVKHFIFFSCTVMYPSQKKPIKELEIKNSNSIYKAYFGVAKTKLFIEDLCKFYSNLSPSKFTCIRHSNIYGPHDKFDLNKSHFFGASVNKILNAKNSIKIWGSGHERRDLLYVDDLINFVKKVLSKQKNNFRIYNCGYGSHYSVNQIVNLIKKISRKKIKIENDLSKPSIKTSLALNTNLAKKELGWKKNISLEKGIKKTIYWYKKNYLQFF